MKSNIVMKSADRVLFGITVKQQTENTFMSITDLQKAYEVARWQHGWNDRRINDILQSPVIHERIYHLLNERKMIKAEIPVFMDMVDKEGIVKVMKGLKVWKTSGRGDNKSVYADPYIWTLMALELNPLIYAKVVLWITDSLIFDRIEAGTEYKPMNICINTIVKNPDFIKITMSINERVFGYHQTGMRQLASATQLKKIAAIEKFIINSIQMGFIKTQDDILKAIKNYN